LPNHVRSDYQQAREALGARFRQLRKDAGLTGKQVAERLGWSQPKVSRIERGQRTPSEEDLQAFAQLVRATAEITDELLTKVRTVHSVHAAWRRQLAGGAAVGQHDILELEASVRLVRAFEPAVIPGMLETDDYARMLFDDVVALYGIPNDAEEAVRIRLRRQQLIHDPARRFEFVIGEAALRSQVCPPPVMRAQLDLVRALSNLETVDVFILPTDAKLPFLPLHGFWIFDDELVSVETVHIRVEASDPSEVALYLRVFDQLKASALGEEAARALLTRVIEQWRQIEGS
jgi:transcriptional regulator with XRE-family HTH domain